MITLNSITLSRGTKVLLKDASVTLFEKQKVGLVGRNGCGKSTLFSLLLNHISIDAGSIQINPKLNISHLSQIIPDSDETGLDFVLTGDKDYYDLQTALIKAEHEGNHEKVIHIHNQLAETDGYSKPAKAAAIMAGLGFKAEEIHQPVASFSGGWRMRLGLARCLISPSDIMLLDEPTNHLDMEAIYWLERFLKQSPATIILISHDRDFLDGFASHILHIEQQALTLYTGNYSRFEELRAQKLALQQASYEKQQTQISHMMKFVDKFKAKASKAKQAQSRLKAIDRMELIAAAQIDSPFSFEFLPCPNASNPLIRLDEVEAGYIEGKPVLKDIHFLLAPGDRIALLGPNGEGKSTFIKSLTGELPLLKGEREKGNHLHIGYFAQHQIEQLDLSLSPIEALQKETPNAREQVLRNFLGGFNFLGDMATSPMTHFSGGEKARLVLAKIVWLKPNVLLLDEPTNHLDLDMRSALELALQSFEGALVLISHDRHLVRMAVDDFYLVYHGKIGAFAGDLDDYYQWLQTQTPSASTAKSPAKNNDKDNKTKQNRLKKIELALTTLHQEQKTLEANINDPVVLQHYNQLKEEIDTLEAEWMDLMT